MFRFLLVFLLIYCSLTFSQTLTGAIADDLSKPLESANIIAKPLTVKASLKFAIADNKTQFK
jgi:hypothetical protein